MTAHAAVHLTTDTQLDDSNPWPGLASYDESSFAYFSGRIAETEELLRRILDEPITVLFGKSGLGKTSLLRAGVFPRLRAHDILPIVIRLQIRPDAGNLTDQVRAALVAELEAQGVDHPAMAPDESLWAYLHRGNLELWNRQNRLVRPVFVFDQFEEVFTLGRVVPAAVERFREDLADLAENRIPAALADTLEETRDGDRRLNPQAMPYKVVIALREDFLADLEGWRVTMPSLRRNRMRLLPMGPRQALQAVWNERTRHLVDEELARKIVAFLSSGAAGAGDESLEGAGPAVEPALLSLFCRGVNEHRKRAGKPRFDQELIEGGQGTIVADFYRSSLADQPPRVRQFVEEELITEHGFRNSYSVDDAVARGLVTAHALETLINRHLLRHEHHLGAERVELTHDLLTRAVVEERDTRRTAERAARERRHRLRLTAIAAVSAAIALIFFALSIKASRAERLAREERDRSRSRELGALGATHLNQDPELAILLAMRGLTHGDTAEARSTLLEAARYAWPSALLGADRLHGHPDAIALSNDGGRLAVVADSHIVTMWDVTKRTLTEVWGKPLDLAGSSAVAFTADGRYLAVARQTSIDVVDASTGAGFRSIANLPEVSERRLVFSPDGRWVATNDEVGFIRLVDYVSEPPRVERVAAPNVIGFSLLSGDRIVAVRDPLAAVALTREKGKWKTEEFGFGSCTRPQSVSPGVAFFSATWRARACMFDSTDGRAVDERSPEHGSTNRPTEDIVWSAGGTAAAELLVEQNGASDILVEQHPSNRPPDRLKGAHINSFVNERTRLIALNRDGGRLAIIDDDDEHKQVRIYSLGNQRPFLTALPEETFAVAPDGSWVVTGSLGVDGKPGGFEVIGLDRMDPQSLLAARARGETASPIARVFATRDSVVAVQNGYPDVTAVFDAATGRPRFPPVVARAVPIGPGGDLLLLEPSDKERWRLVKTADGTPVPMPAAFATSSPDADLAVILSPDRLALAAVTVTRDSPQMTASVFLAVGEALVATGQLTGLERSHYSDLVLNDDGRTIDDQESGKRFTVGAAGGVARQDAKAAPGRSPRGTYEIQPHSRLVRLADQKTIRQFPFDVSGSRFSRGERWLAVWSTSEIQVLDPRDGTRLFSLELPGIERVEFVASESVLVAHHDSRVTAIPIERGLLERFAGWLAPRPLTENERLRLGIEAPAGQDGAGQSARAARYDGGR